MDDQQFAKILEYFNFSWEGYRKVRKGVKKRISRHMQELGCRNVEQYLAVIAGDRQAGTACERHLTVSISRFYRDRHLWDALREYTLPALVAASGNSADRGDFKVWSCGCARGEEAYTFAILWTKFRSENQAYEQDCRPLPKLELWATDMNPAYLEMAIAGVYEYRSMKELPSEDTATYFQKLSGKNRYLIDPHLKKNIIFSQHDIIRDPPPPVNFSLVFLRNSLLTYYRSPQKENALKRVIAAMKSGAALIVGSHERLPGGLDFMIPSVHSPWIFHKNPVS